MEAPFIFGKIVSELDFTNRESETQRLITNFNSLTNTILISPRRWGKSSLVKKASDLAAKANPKLRFCFIDLYNVRSEEEFYQTLATEILKATSSKTETFIEDAKKFLGRILPKISMSLEANSEISLGFDFEEIMKKPDEILNLAENLAIEKDLKIIVCIDEFQNLTGFSDPVAFQKTLRSFWQKHQKASYCLYGSKRHMLMEVFTSPSMPFYNFGDILFLEKIKTEDWIPFIKDHFSATNKSIDTETAVKIVDSAENYPYYVQQLAQQVWLRTDKKCNIQIVETSTESLVMQLGLLFQTITDQLSNTQINFLLAVLKGAEKLSSQATLAEYKLGTSANVQRIKKTLIDKEIIDIQSDIISFLDPMYKYWLKNFYFRIK
jgi:energy-coupling factor transporter ATP-binding protein EcfA2